jgi:hypothetical protein
VMNCEELGGRVLWPNLKYPPEVCLAVLWNITKYLTF